MPDQTCTAKGLQTLLMSKGLSQARVRIVTKMEALRILARIGRCYHPDHAIDADGPALLCRHRPDNSLLCNLAAGSHHSKIKVVHLPIDTVHEQELTLAVLVTDAVPLHGANIGAGRDRIEPARGTRTRIPHQARCGRKRARQGKTCREYSRCDSVASWPALGRRRHAPRLWPGTDRGAVRTQVGRTHRFSSRSALASLQASRSSMW
nr:hypothetical protein [Novosphingobium resinovorum]